MLLLMRRVGEVVRINETITLKIKEILQDENVVFQIEGLDVDQMSKLGGKYEEIHPAKKTEEA